MSRSPILGAGLLLAVIYQHAADAFTTTGTSRPLGSLSHQSSITTSTVSSLNVLPNPGDGETDRRSFVSTVIGGSLLSAASIAATKTISPAFADDNSSESPKISTDEQGVTVYKTKSGLQYIELSPTKKSNPKTPRYGQLCVITYTAYMKLPNDATKQKFDEDNAGFIIKHGNAKMIPGLDEGIHTMQVGSTRRLIIPPKLGFVEGGLGPMPEYPWARWKLNSLLDDMIKQRGGNLIYDVTLVKVIDDEADQGYYEDESLTAEEFEQIQNVLNRNKSAQTQAAETRQNQPEQDENTSVKNIV